MHAVGRHNPQALTRTCPPRRLAQQAYQTAQIAVCHSCLGGDKRLTGLIVDVDVL